MVEKEWFGVFLQSFVHFVVPSEAKVDLAPKEIGLLDSLLFSELFPVASVFKRLDDVNWEVAFSHGKGEVTGLASG